MSYNHFILYVGWLAFGSLDGWLINWVHIATKMGSPKTDLGCVGRGVLRFWDARYRKPRSKLGLFSGIYAVSGIGGVDII